MYTMCNNSLNIAKYKQKKKELTRTVTNKKKVVSGKNKKPVEIQLHKLKSK